MSVPQTFQIGDRFIVGGEIVVLDEQFHASLQPGDEVLAVAATHSLKRIPSEVSALVDSAVTQASQAFRELGKSTKESITEFFRSAALLLADDVVAQKVLEANELDVQDAAKRGRSTTRLVLSPKMRSDMVAAFEMWRDLDMDTSVVVGTVEHDGWSVDQWRSPLGVIGFVFEGRPNVFADATGVLKSGNTVVFRIGSDALRTADAIMQNIVTPSLARAGLPLGAVQLVASKEHAAGWKLFSDTRLSLAVARGSGEAVAELGAIAQQAGIPVSLHGTGGAWMIVGESANASDVQAFVQHSLDRKVCNTLNVLCMPRSVAPSLMPAVVAGATLAAEARGTVPRIHAVNGAEAFIPSAGVINVTRAHGTFQENQVSTSKEADLGHEFEWEENPEFFVVLTDSLHHGISLFNTYSPQFVVSGITNDESEREEIWLQCNAPFVGDGFTRWVDGQFALLRPELGLSNWQNGRLFARGGVLSGDSAYTIRLRVRQENISLHR